MNLSAESLVLSTDTSTPVQSVAVLRGSQVLFEAEISQETKGDGPGLLSLVDAGLKQCELELSGIDRLVVSRGPGAFTGLRVSMAMFKSFALTLDRPLYGESSLEALARAALPCAHVTAACIDARRGEIYAAFYREVDGKVQCLTDELLLKPEEFGELSLKLFPDEIVMCVGTAFPHYTERVCRVNSRLCCRRAAPRASELGRMVLEKYPESLPPVALEALEPRYIRIEEFAVARPFDFSQPGQFRNSQA